MSPNLEIFLVLLGFMAASCAASYGIGKLRPARRVVDEIAADVHEAHRAGWPCWCWEDDDDEVAEVRAVRPADDPARSDPHHVRPHAVAALPPGVSAAGRGGPAPVDDYDISEEEFEAAKAHVMAVYGRIPPSLQRVIDRGGRFKRSVRAEPGPELAGPEWVPDERVLAEMTPRMRRQYERERALDVPRPAESAGRPHEPADLATMSAGHAGPGHPGGRDLFAGLDDDSAFTLIHWELRRMAWMGSEPFALPAWPERAAA